MPWVQLTTRRWYVRDGAAPLGRQIAVLPFPFRAYSWGPLWQALRRRCRRTPSYGRGYGSHGHQRYGGRRHTGSRRTAHEDGDSTRAARARRRGEGSGERAHRRRALHTLRPGHRRRRLPLGGPRRRVSRCAARLRRLSRLARRRTCRPAGGRSTSPACRADPWAEEDCIYGVFPGGHVIIYRIPDGHGRPPRQLGPVHRPARGPRTPAWTAPTSLPPGTLTERPARPSRAGHGRVAAALLGRADPADATTGGVHPADVRLHRAALHHRPAVCSRAMRRPSPARTPAPAR